MFFYTKKVENPLPCRDEKISRSGGAICRKPTQALAELLENRCKNCGRPFEGELLDTGEKEEGE